MKTLTGRTILVTRARDQAGALSEALERHGARVIASSVIGFEEPLDWGPVDAAIERLDTYRWILFSSANAVDRFLDRVIYRGHGIEELRNHRLAGIGPSTARHLTSRGLAVEGVPAAHRAEGFVEYLLAQGVDGQRLLMPRAESGRELLPRRLREAGAHVDVVTVYRTVPMPLAPGVIDRIHHGGVDLVTFTSTSTVENLLTGLGGPAALGKVDVAAIGPVTAEALNKRGLTPTVVAPEATVEALVRAIVRYYSG